MNCNQANSAAQIEQDVNVSITGGDFAGALQDVDASFVADNDKKFISGGTFAQDLSESGYLADAVQYEVGHTGGTFTYAKTLADAQSAAKPGDTITDLKATADSTASLTLNYNDDGATTNSVYTVAKNTDVTLPEPTRDGYVFLGWYDADGNKVESPYTVSKTETLTAQWSVISSSTSYAITVESSDNGTVTASRTRANKGLTITLTVKADEGYALDTLTVTDKNGNEIKLTDKGDGKYTFTMPSSAVTVKASFAKDDTPVETGLPFTDVKADDWFYEAVKYAYDNKLMDGTASTTFAPLMTTNRAMIVTILWRQAGSPVVNYAMNFSDVESGVWYTEAVRWAAAEGIVKGYSDTVFAPDDTVTREQLATILYRYAGYKEYDVSAKGDLTTFADGSTVSTWAADGMTWAVGAQLITGKDGGKLDPTGTATRAEVATILMRFCENVAK
ncbi:S-layer homology domain-containing protein [Flavonifractor sp. An91]|uniref:S-layer homology domain-containing protein n=1 Tax=Flavonifractor sp. An91 TaxID=1965665 RepID=UPI0013A674B3|nr:S-layer homology domain-containing protein [Flavonifractor sp. An91]